jgi:hypothetical protein
MITKFVGSPTDLNKVKRIALVYSSSILLESQINLLTPNYLGSSIKYIIDATDSIIDGEHTNEFVLTDFSPFIFNAVVFYDLDMNPIGFSMLDQEVTTIEYNIETIIIIPNFIINLTDDRYIEISLGDTNYTEHIANTNKVHKRLFNAENYAMTSEQVLNQKYNPTKFTNQVKEAIQLKRVYRYAGNFSMANNKLLHLNFELNTAGLPENSPRIDVMSTYLLPNGKSLEYKSSWCRIFKIDDFYYFIDYDGNSLIIRGLNTNTNVSISIRNIVQFGSNMFVTYTSEDGYLIYSTPSIINNELVLLSKVNSSFTNYIRFAREFDDESIHPYKLQSPTNPEVITNKMKDLFSRLKVNRYLKSMMEIVGFTQNLLIYKIGSTTCFLSDVSVSNKDGVVNSVPFRYEFQWDQLEVISNKAVIIHRTSSDTWKLFQIIPTDSSKMIYKSIVYELGTTNNWRKLDFIAKTQVNPYKLAGSNNSPELSILMNPIDGNVWRYSKTDNKLIFSTL